MKDYTFDIKDTRAWLYVDRIEFDPDGRVENYRVWLHYYEFETRALKKEIRRFSQVQLGDYHLSDDEIEELETEYRDECEQMRAASLGGEERL